MSRIRRFLQKLISQAGSVLISLLREVFNRSTTLAIESVESVVWDAVEEVATDPTLITDEQKRAEMLKRAKDRLAMKGKIVRDSIIMLTAELIIRALKNRKRA